MGRLSLTFLSLHVLLMMLIVRRSHGCGDIGDESHMNAGTHWCRGIGGQSPEPYAVGAIRSDASVVLWHRKRRYKSDGWVDTSGTLSTWSCCFFFFCSWQNRASDCGGCRCATSDTVIPAAGSMTVGGTVDSRVPLRNISFLVVVQSFF